MLFQKILRILGNRFSYVNHSKFQGLSTSLTVLQNQYTGYSYNLVDGASPYSPGSSYPL